MERGRRAIPSLERLMDELSGSRRVVQQVEVGAVQLAGCARHADFAGAAGGEIAVVALGFEFLHLTESG